MRGIMGCFVVGGLCLLPLATCSAALVATDRSQVDEDYAVQGEYVGEVLVGDELHQAGAHVIALSGGKFNVKVYHGGLPGDGWNKEGIETLQAQRNPDGDVVVLHDEGGQQTKVGRIDDSKLIFDCDEAKGTLERVERKSKTLGAKAPEGAKIIVGDGVNATDGRMNTNDQLWAGATTRDAFDKPYQLHLEFMLPYMPAARGQARANSGVYLHDAYEVQVLDSFGLEGLDNECAGIYTVKRPDVNMCFPPLQWQTYDIEFTPPQYEGGRKTAPARLTLKHNGVVVHDDIELRPTPGRKGEGPGPRQIHFQEHGNKVQYRNMWLLERND